MDDELSLEELNSLGEVGVLAGAEVLLAGLDGAVVLEELDEPADEFLLGVLFQVSLLLDGQLYVEVGVALGRLQLLEGPLGLYVVLNHDSILLLLRNH